MKYILNISIYLSFLKVIKTLHPMISMWSVFYTYTLIRREVTLHDHAHLFSVVADLHE